MVVGSSWRMKQLLDRGKPENAVAAEKAVDEPVAPAVGAKKASSDLDRGAGEVADGSAPTEGSAPMIELLHSAKESADIFALDGLTPYREYGAVLPQSWPEILRRTLLPQGFWSPNNAYASVEVAEHCAMFEISFSGYLPNTTGLTLTPAVFLRTAVVSILTALPITGFACTVLFYIVAVVHLCFGIGLLVARPFRRPWEVVPASVCCFLNALLAIGIAEPSLKLRSDAILSAIIGVSLATLVLTLATFVVEKIRWRPQLTVSYLAKSIPLFEHQEDYLGGNLPPAHRLSSSANAQYDNHHPNSPVLRKHSQQQQQQQHVETDFEVMWA